MSDRKRQKTRKEAWRRGVWVAAVVALGLLAGSVRAEDAPSVRIAKGPYLQQVTDSSIVIMWETNAAAGSRVSYGLLAPGEFLADDPTPVTLHEMWLTGLSAGTTYQYNVTSEGATSATATFTTAPEPAQPFRLVIYGDTRSNPADHAAVAAGIIASDPVLVLNTGDLASNGSYDSLSAEFFAPARDLMLETPVLPALGNHEENSPWYYALLSLPGNEQWYAFTYGCTRIVCLDTNVDFAPGTAQHDWLLSELTSRDYAQACWQLVFFHHPPHSATFNHGDNGRVQRDLVPLFEQHGVDLVFSGHSHAYERYTSDGIVYIVTGGGGGPLYPLAKDLHPPFREAGASVYHHVVLDITPASARLAARLNDGTEFDAIELAIANQPPLAVADSYPATEDIPLNIAAPGVLANDFDREGAPLTATLVRGPSHGALVLSSDGAFVYVPDTNFFGADSFTYRTHDGETDGNTTTVTLAVAGVNDPPVARDDFAFAEQGIPLNIPVPANDTEVDGEPLTIVSVTQPANGATTHDGAAVTYTPAAGHLGADAFTYTIGDGTGETDTASVTIVTSPYARPDIYGRVTDPAGNGVPGVTVKLKGRKGVKWKGTVLTDAWGCYRFGDLPLGLFRLKVKLKKWRLDPRRADASLTAPDSHVLLEFSGRPK